MRGGASWDLLKKTRDLAGKEEEERDVELSIFSGESVKQSLKSGELSLERKLSRYDFYSLLSSH